jgi:copper transport protein
MLSPRFSAGAAGILVLAVLGFLAVAAGEAGAHAVLVDTDPTDGAQLDEAPDRVQLRFNEPVELVEGGLRVHDADAERVDAGVAESGEDGTIAVDLPPDLPEGGYLVVYRVVSADSHPLGGVLGFTVGDGAAVADVVVEDLTRADGAISVVGPALRGGGYVGTLLAAGAVVFAVTIARRHEDRVRAQRVGLAATGLALVLGILAFPVQTMATSGSGVVAALAPGAVAETLGSSFGQSWLVRMLALILLALVLRRGRPTWVVLIAAAVAPASYLLDGHTRSVEPAWLLMAGDAVHLAAGALWFGGLTVLALSVRARSLEDDPVDAARLVARFSAAALWAVVALAVSGAAMSWALVRVPGALTSTGYGWTLIAKVGLVAVAVAVAAYNRSRLVPAITARMAPAGGSVAAAPEVGSRTVQRSREAWRLLGGTLRLEGLLLLVVLLLTGFLATQRPAAEQAGVTGLYDTSVAITDELDLDVVVDPNRAGETNAIHLYVLDATGRPSGEVEDLALELLFEPEDIGPLPVEPFPAGPGHWVANVDELTFPGQWRLTVTLGVGRFDEERVEVLVPVR